MEKKYPKQVKKFGERIKKLRKKADLTQEELGEKAGVNMRTIIRIESGEFAAGLHIVFALSKALKIKVSELF